ADVCLLQIGIDAWRISAFGQPKTKRLRPEKIDIRVAADENLCARRFARLLTKQRQQSMRRSRGDNFEHAAVAQLPERGEEIAFPFVDKEAPAQAEKMEIEIG